MVIPGKLRNPRGNTDVSVDPFHDFDPYVIQVLTACETEVSAYPPWLRDSGLAYLQKLELAGRSRRTQGITILLPFWLNDIFGLSRDTCCVLALGSAYTLLHFLAQDELMDEPVSQASRTELATLSSLFFSGLNRQYRRCFESDSPFWAHLDRYVEQWGESTLWECHQHWGQPAPYPDHELLLVARKNAPLKVPVAAMGLLSHREHLIVGLDTAIDHAMLTFQMLDDLRDWRADLANLHYSHFLALVAHSCASQSSGQQLSIESVEEAIFCGEAIDAVLDLALHHNQLALNTIVGWRADHLRSFLHLQRRWCTETRNSLQRTRTRLLRASLKDLIPRPHPEPGSPAVTNERSGNRRRRSVHGNNQGNVRTYRQSRA